ncbi:MAG: alpha/beta fold hydrolase, partial [Planctomycetes bacterium]|nr:alpha/beta fold hydrolase [Planctomycetota bacterium]
FDAALAVAALPAALLQQVARGDRQLAESLLELELRTAGESLAALERGSAPLPLPHGATRHVLDHPTTGELTPWLALAPAADGAGPRPLLVALHGLLAREESWLQYGDGALAREAARHGFIVVAPHGWRTDSFWVGHAETEVLALIDAACARWPIDRNRIALIGHSMGAMGALRLAAHHPDRFHAVAAIAGGGLPGWIRPLAGHSIMLAHGAADTVVPVALSRTLVASARATGAEWPLMELPDADHVSVVAATLPAVLDFLAAAPPRPSPGPPPARSDR